MGSCYITIAITIITIINNNNNNNNILGSVIFADSG